MRDASTQAQVDAFHSRLSDDSDLKSKVVAASELRDAVDSFQSSPADYEYYLQKMMPVYTKILESTPVSFTSISVEQKLRSSILEILLRLQTNDLLKPYSSALLEQIMSILRTDNEENGVTCMKILTALHKGYKAHLGGDHVTQFLELVTDLYKNIPSVVKDTFGVNQTGSSNFQSPMSPSLVSDGDVSVATPGGAASRPLAKSLFSFKVLIECPIIVVLLFSTHRAMVPTLLPQFLPHVIEMLRIQAPPQAEAHAQAEARGDILTTISPQIRNRAAYGDFITCQVKTMSFLAYALRGFPPFLQEYHVIIPDLVVRLLQDCPCELSAARKELLVAARHITSTDIRTMFIPKIDILLEERVLIGDGLTVRETLKPLAYSIMADLIHHVRSELTLQQIWKTVKVYCANMLDASLANSFQIMSAKLLLNLVDPIMKLQDRNEGRQTMVLILNAFTELFGALNRTYPNVMRGHERWLKEQAEKKAEGGDKPIAEVKPEEDIQVDVKLGTSAESSGLKRKAEDLEVDEVESNDVVPQKPRIESEYDFDYFEIQASSLIKIHPTPTTDPLEDARYLFKNLMNFLKTVMFGLKSCNPPCPIADISEAVWNESARLFNFEQITIFRKLFEEGIKGHLFFASHVTDKTATVANNDLGAPSLPVVSSKAEKDLMETFVTVFIHIDSASFNEIIESELPFLYDAMFSNSALLHIPQFFMASEATSANFSSLLISFLKEKLPELGDGNIQKSNILIRLFKLCFMAVNLFPAQNEAVLLPHLKSLIIDSMKLTTTSKDPIVYFYLLRTLFRSIGGGRFELLYKEVLPLLQSLLESLNKLLLTARKPQERDIYVELCLTVPVRLSVLVPHLSYLMSPLVVALNGSQELVSQGLRTLELCVDNLTAEYFDPIIEPVMDKVMQALWNHLKPLPYYHQHSHTTLRILGKLGGRNRRFLTPPDNLKTISAVHNDLAIVAKFQGVEEKLPVNITPALEASVAILEDSKRRLEYRVSAFKYLSGCLKLLIDAHPIASDMSETIKKAVTALTMEGFPKSKDNGEYHLKDGKVKYPVKRKLEDELLTMLLESLFFSLSIDAVKEEATELIHNLCDHFVFLNLGRYVLDKRKELTSFDLNEHEGKTFLDCKAIIGAIMFALSHYNESIKQGGIDAIKHMFNTGVTVFGSKELAFKFPLYVSMYRRFSHGCFEEEYYRKYGAVLGLKTLMQDLDCPLRWIQVKQIEFTRTILFVCKDVPPDVPGHVRDVARNLYLHILRRCNTDLSAEQMADKSFKQVVGLLAYDLGNANISVRETSKQALATLAEVTKSASVSAILEPVKTILLAPIFGKPLRALPFPMQIGHIDAITYCLGLGNGFLPFNDELTRLILEALALVDAEDESLTAAHRVFEQRTAEQLVQLRIVCIKLLSAALAQTEYTAIQAPPTRSKIIAVFFKTLYSRSDAVIEAAHQGLRSVLSNKNKLPKDLLQNGLKPILMSLSDHKRLSVAGLQGLAKLLELLTSYFKVEIGRKLLDHLRACAEPQTLHQLATHNLSLQQNVQIIVAILNVFHLLPSTAHTFMNDIVNMIVYLERNLRRQQKSPFRVPVGKFFNCYPEQTFDYFAPKLQDRTLGRLFSSILTEDVCDELRGVVITRMDELVAKIGELQGGQRAVAICNLVEVVASVNAKPAKPKVVKEEKKEEGEADGETKAVTKTEDSTAEIKPVMTPQLLSKLVGHVKDLPALVSKTLPTDPIHIQTEQTIETLQNIAVAFLKSRDPSTSSIDMVFGLIKVFTSNKELKISWSFQQYIFNSLVCSTDVLMRRKYLTKAVELCSTSRHLNIAGRIFVFNKLVNPILIVEQKRNKSLALLLDKISQNNKAGNWLDLVHTKIWRPSQLDATDDKSASIDQLRFELLHLSALLINYAPQLVAEGRKDMIKFGWNFIKLDDIVSKQAAYVVISYFIAAYETLPKIVIQIYVALLKTSQNEARQLVKQALDLLAPVLPDRIPSPTWAKWPRRVLSEYGHNIMQVIGVYQFVVRYPDLFYEYSVYFVPNIIATMPKLSFSPGSPSENQNLAADLAGLLLKWEERAKREYKLYENGEWPIKEEKEVKKEGEVKEEKKEGEPEVAEEEPPKPPPESVLSSAQLESVVTYLIRYICMYPQKVVDSPLASRILDILKKLLEINVQSRDCVKLTFFDRSLVQNDLNSPNTLCLCLNALEVVKATIATKSDQWILENLPHLERLLEKCIKSNNSDIQEVLQGALSIILKAIKNTGGNTGGSVAVPGATDAAAAPEADSSIPTIITLINNTILENLGSPNSISAGTTLCWTLFQVDPTMVDFVLAPMMKAFGKLCKDHITQSGDGDGEASLPELERSMTTKLLVKILDLTSTRVSYLGDQRRVFLSLFAQLIERSPDPELCKKMISITRGWIFSKTELFPSMKEKAAILGKMIIFENRGDATLKKLLYQVIIDIYTDPQLAKSELSIRMETPFLVGTRSEDCEIRSKLMSILNESLPENSVKRLFYIVGHQNWEALGDYQWIHQGLQLIYNTIEGKLELQPGNYLVSGMDGVGEGLGGLDVEIPDDLPTSPELKPLLQKHGAFLKGIRDAPVSSLLNPLVDIQYCSPETVNEMWALLFPVLYGQVPRKDKTDFSKALVTLLSKEYHNRQAEARPNVIQAFLKAFEKCQGLLMPPHLLKYLGKSFDGWFEAVKCLEDGSTAAIPSNSQVDSAKIEEANLDALAELYAGIQEDDTFYGLWRRRARYTETNSAISYEQCGMWSRALQLYEAAQIKARSGALPYGESEYSLWEDHWILCAQKLQQWDILTELAKHEGFTDLLLECGWRVADWNADKEPLEQSIRTVMDVPTPRRQIFETFLCLQSYAQKGETLQTLSKYCDEGIQLVLQNWAALPTPITGAHLPLLHTFQQYVEFMEASQVYTSLASTTAQNLDAKSQELKGVLQAWRERLPNVWDDINIWGDLVTWRQHAFGVINRVYLGLVPQGQQGQQGQQGAGASTSSFAYRGYHEIAWIINRFAHVARVHNMPDVCINQLSKIYTLPNIEIQEAFLKLREQAKCHYQNQAELNTGLDVISNTNLAYFVAQQKAEFFTLKGMFLAKLNVQDDANQAFATAVQIDLYLPKAWAEWGYFNDKRFKENPKDIIYANNAISCYLQAAGLYKNGKARKLLGRILWLISLDNQQGNLAQAFQNYRGDVPVWYWIVFIPQLLTSLAHREARMASAILIKIAKTYPQALHFHLRTTKEDYSVLQRQAMAARASGGTPGAAGAGGTPGASGAGAGGTPAAGTPPGGSPAGSAPWEYVDEIMGILKTAYPLLALSLETLVDQIYQRFKCQVDEDAYRLIMALLNDGVQYMGRLPYPKEDAKLPATTEANITRFAESVLPKHIKSAFEAEFVTDKPNLETYVTRLRKWRDRFEEKLDSRNSSIHLEALSPHLSEFHYQKFEDIEVPGQYLQLKDSNMHFVKIDRFMPTVSIVRGHGICYKRLTIRGHDGSMHPFAVQYPSARHCRREERVMQLFRILNDALSRNRETRKRYLQFTLPLCVPLSPHIRLVQDDSRYVSMQAIYEDFCHRKNVSRDEPSIFAMHQLRAAFDSKLPKPDISSIKMEILSSIQEELVPKTVFSDYFTRIYPQFSDFWLFRKQFSYSYAGVTFLIFMMSINNRYANKILINTGSGNVWTTDIVPVLPPQKSTPTFHNGEAVPFRLTPNIQQLMGPTNMEGLFSFAIMLIARAVTEPEFSLDQYMSLFVRDEMISWYTQQHRPSVQDQQLREIVKVNVDGIVKRASSLAQVGQGNVPANQTVIDLISQAVNPRYLALTDNLWQAYL
ncbi:hypothetical protein B0I72DRAFT_92085 [Yarrowia lipolytica]|uniref:Uncharacterized protein n=1 Tax=Yarrowia lipolytica TaxID=4952 RepID=A0A371C9C4_YARLL|nr:hypothetical protein B0I71DRAFT_95500 [Yarrowia lipolytica]RDW35112.1 hypothetical protein B0I72DRAFT_92085 [Yarrowia lipolytica]RDW40477.1 hypothetical protein B0I73DRAFT_95845 [Yarrowia lipolytica]RDW47694.1 hypothetical protein B0I74DRAFT_94120 [Yarrowia lipolytica]RDW53914.1 hypothetical protein B0I75DRAFT_101160 [Yarrowia lipolytica]